MVIFVEGIYDNDYSKIALAMTSAQIAKMNSVKEHGIGEDLAINFLGWGGDTLSIVCQMKKSLMERDHSFRLEKSKELCKVLRKYWGVSALTMVAEGYCSLDKSRTEGQDLAKAFLDPNKPVKECITVVQTSIEIGDDEPAATIIAIPYYYEVGKVVKWSEMLFYPDGGLSEFRNSKYPDVMLRALNYDIVDDLPPSGKDDLVKIISDNGFMIQDFR
jgi:hypothetical protein